MKLSLTIQYNVSEACDEGKQKKVNRKGKAGLGSSFCGYIYISFILYIFLRYIYIYLLFFFNLKQSYE